jgi:exodeoxyribonuclease VII large subunit
MDSNPAAAANNVPEYAVSEISGAIKRTLEQAFGRVRVRGELTEVKRYPSGHIYLSLKDEGGKLAGVIWKTSVRNLALQPENGVEVIATGRISAYGDRSTYQLIIERLDYAGEGALLARIEKLRVKLLAEGLFDPARKRALPMLPAVIGVVTSESGAVIQDIRTTLLRRFPRRLILWPVAVQGAGAAEQIAAAIDGFSALPEHGPVPRPDVVIVARGGGSLEDLMAFNEEVVVRAAAACSIPLISAVGHETDTTLIDFASDKRAPTPTAAAELAVPARADLLADLAQRTARLLQATRAVTERAHRRLVQAERQLPDLPNLLGGLRQRLEDRGERLAVALPAMLGRKRRALAEVAPRLPHPREQLAGKRHALALLVGRGEAALRRTLALRAAQPALGRLSAAPVQALLRERKARLEGLAARLEGVSYAATLARGFVLVQDSSGAPVTSAAAVAAGEALALHFADGQVGVTADGAKPARRKAKASGEQGALL